MRDQDVNQIYLNKYLATIEVHDAYDMAIDARVNELLAMEPTCDDAYELFEHLTMRHTMPSREHLAELFRRMQATEGRQAHHDMAANLGHALYSALCENRATRALDQAINEEAKK